MRTERDIKCVDECGLSHTKTNQQPLGNKNVLSVIVNYKNWSSPCCRLLIMLNGLPLTIMKPLTLCVSVCSCVYVFVRERKRLYGCLFEEICCRFFMALKAPVPNSLSLVCSRNITFTCLLSVYCSVPDIFDQNEESKEREERKLMGIIDTT